MVLRLLLLVVLVDASLLAVPARADDKPAAEEKKPEGEKEKQAQRPPALIEYLPYFLIPVLAYFLLFRPRRPDPEAERRAAISKNLKKNDKVMVGQLLIGTVHSVSDTEDEVVVKLDENVRLRFVKDAIHRNFSYEERVKAAKESKGPSEAGGASGAADSVRKA
jgi:preprotein translocase YajC subunit